MTVTDPARALAGRREAGLLEVPSVRRMAEVLAVRCREPSWVRTMVAGLDRFQTLTGSGDLEALLTAARAEPAAAGQSLAALARALHGQPDAAVAGLAMAPKVWFRLGGVPVPWRPLPAALPARELPAAGTDGPDRVVLLSLIGSGLHRAELLRVRLGDLGSLDENGRVVPDLEAEPFAVRFEQRRGRTAERITFLSFQARRAILDDLDRRRRAGLATGPETPLVTDRTAVAAARRRSGALIRAGSTLNVDMCRKTGEFFRTWGMPGARFVPPAAADLDGGEDP